MSKEMKFLATMVLLLVSACATRIEFPVALTVPPQAIDLQVNVTSDGTNHELAFRVAANRDDYSAINDIQKQLTQAGYHRCDTTGGKGDMVNHRIDGRIIEENRVLRFFNTSEPGQMAMLLATQHCSNDRTSCMQYLRIRQISMPKSIPNRQRYVEAICRGTSFEPTSGWGPGK